MSTEDFSYIDEFEVTLGGMPVRSLNELEYISGELWANVWQTNYVVRINPDNGNISSVIDLSGLEERTRRNGPDAVLMNRLG
jgi:glutamine cyclotransferase